MPTIHTTGALYAALGYTTVFDAAIATAAAGIAHAELAELPILDKGIYLLAADQADVLAAAARDDQAGLRRLLAAAIAAGRGWTVEWNRDRLAFTDIHSAGVPSTSIGGNSAAFPGDLVPAAVGGPDHPADAHRSGKSRRAG